MSTANVIIPPPKKNDGMEIDEDIGNDVNCVPNNLCGGQLLSDAELDLQETGGKKLITDELQAFVSGPVRFNYIPTF